MSSPQENPYLDDPTFSVLWQNLSDLGYPVWEAYGDHPANHKVYVEHNGQRKAVGFAHELIALPPQRLAELLAIYFPPSQKRWIEASNKYFPLKMAACKVARDLGGNAYFVGSALHSLTRPRDVDVRIILPDAAFETRYHLSVFEWKWQAHTCEWSEQRWAWYEEQERYRAIVSHACGERTVDLSILPESLWKAIYEAAPHETWGTWDSPIEAKPEQ